MKSFTLQNYIVMAAACILGSGLLYTSQNVQNSADRLSAIEGAIQQELERIGVLKAEWEYLNSPQRLEALAKEYYGYEAPTTSQMIGGELDLPFPAPIENTQGSGYQSASYGQEGSPE